MEASNAGAYTFSLILVKAGEQKKNIIFFSTDSVHPSFFKDKYTLDSAQL